MTDTSVHTAPEKRANRIPDGLIRLTNRTVTMHKQHKIRMLDARKAPCQANLRKQRSCLALVGSDVLFSGVMNADRILKEYERTVREVARLEMALGQAHKRRHAARRAMLEAGESAGEEPSIRDSFLIPGETLDAFTLSERSGISVEAARQKLSRANRTGIVVRVHHGGYQLAPETEPLAETA